RRRICRALNAETLDEVAGRIAAPTQPEGWFGTITTSPDVAPPATAKPRNVQTGPCQQILNLGSDVDLRRLPLITSASLETAPSITAAVLLTAESNSRRPLAGSWDMQVLGPDRLGVFWSDHDEPARLLGEYVRRGEKMPIATVLGGDPAVLLAARALLPPTADILSLAGLLRERPLDLVPCRGVDLQVPADAEIIIEGYIDPSEPTVEAGPLCMPSGYCTTPRPVPLMQVTAITHRANPVYPAIVPGQPPNEACVIDRALGRIFLPLVRLAIAELVDFDLPQFGAARHWAVLSIRKSHAGQARRVASAAWGMRQFMFAKVLVVVDEDVDVHDQQQVLAAISAEVDPARDVFSQQGPPDPFDPVFEQHGLGSRLAIDATAKLPAECNGPRAERAAASEEICRLVTDRWAEYGLGPQP
ncbi:MAG: UbiD family decarboxylase, partial [Thermoguttaceae bacterium]